MPVFVKILNLSILTEQSWYSPTRLINVPTDDFPLFNRTIEQGKIAKASERLDNKVFFFFIKKIKNFLVFIWTIKTFIRLLEFCIEFDRKLYNKPSLWDESHRDGFVQSLKLFHFFNRSGSPIHDVAEMDIAIVQIQENREGTDDIDQYIKIIGFFVTP